ncbi:MAG: hypothetical protein FJX76_18650 [Armatimonadetes bacterium]|nr:hypothetical protein [Armatimonadota bacterium]
MTTSSRALQQGTMVRVPPIAWARVVLAVLVAIQVAILIFLLLLFRDPAFYQRRELEARPLINAPLPVVSRADVVEWVHVLSGAAPLVGDSLRRDLAPDTGAFTWLVLRDRPIAGGSSALRATLADGTLNVVYDAGGLPGAPNWERFGRSTLQASPLLAWEKQIDWVVVSCREADRCAGLATLLREQPRVVLAPPPHPQETAAALGLLEAAPNATLLPPGVTRLTSRVVAYVYETEPLAGGRHYALALGVKGAAGATLLNGTEGLPPHLLIARFERASGMRVARFVGATGYRIGLPDPALDRALRALRASHPRLSIVATAATTETAADMLRAVFGARFRATQIGDGIRL